MQFGTESEKRGGVVKLETKLFKALQLIQTELNMTSFLLFSLVRITQIEPNRRTGYLVGMNKMLHNLLSIYLIKSAIPKTPQLTMKCCICTAN